MKPNFLSLLILACISVIFHSCQTSKFKENAQPNIVFILADDMGYGDLGCYNNQSKIPTPHIDKLASEGVRFTNAHAPGAWCVPSRYGLLTGCYPGRLDKIQPWNGSLIKPGQETIASMLKRNGYNTACVGKWHLGFEEVDWDNPASISEMKDGPTQKGFDYFFGMHASLDIQPYFYIENGQAVKSPDGTIGAGASENPTSSVSGAFYRAGAISPDFKHDEVLDKFTEKAFSFIDKQNNKKAPFFLYLPLTAPHTPWLPKPEFVGKSKAGEYGDFTMQVDALVGQVVAYLKEKNLLENTIVFFSSDNGPVWFHEDIEKFEHESVGVLRGMKGDLWEGGSRIPFIARYPAKFGKGKASTQLIGFTDMMATLADVVGDKSINSTNFNSHSFLPVLTNSGLNKELRNDIVVEKKSFIQGDWKLIVGSGQGGIAARYAPDKKYIFTEKIAGELYNLKEDLSEQNNLFDTYPEKVKEMTEALNNIIQKPVQ